MFGLVIEFTEVLDEMRRDRSEMTGYGELNTSN